MLSFFIYRNLPDECLKLPYKYESTWDLDELDRIDSKDENSSDSTLASKSESTNASSLASKSEYTNTSSLASKSEPTNTSSLANKNNPSGSKHECKHHHYKSTETTKIPQEQFPLSKMLSKDEKLPEATTLWTMTSLRQRDSSYMLMLIYMSVALLPLVHINLRI